MSTELTNATLDGILNSYRARLEELERRVLTFPDNPGDDEAGCCDLLCCSDHPNQDQATGVSHAYCSVTLDETAGDALRLVVSGMAVVQMQDASGTVQCDVGISVDGSAFLERGQLRLGMLSGEKVTIPVLTTIDVNTASPTVTLVVRNQDVPTIRVIAVALQVAVHGSRGGSLACGQSAGTS